MSGKSPSLSNIRKKIMPQAIESSVQQEFENYKPEEDMQNMLRYFYMEETDTKKKTKDKSNARGKTS